MVNAISVCNKDSYDPDHGELAQMIAIPAAARSTIPPADSVTRNARMGRATRRGM
jgi:hypothetical protein